MITICECGLKSIIESMVKCKVRFEYSHSSGMDWCEIVLYEKCETCGESRRLKYGEPDRVIVHDNIIHKYRVMKNEKLWRLTLQLF